MATEYEARVLAVQERLAEAAIDAALFADPDTIFYFSGYHGYLGMDFGRPALLFVPRADAPILITPLMESEMCRRMTWIDDIRPWQDGRAGEWRAPVESLIARHGPARLGIERASAPEVVLSHLTEHAGADRLVDVAGLVNGLRRIKSAYEIGLMRDAGQVAVAMAAAAEQSIAEGVPEYEVALAVIGGGTRKAAELLAASGPDAAFDSPTIYNLQILQSGDHTCMAHRRSTNRRLGPGDPVYLCFCGIANYRQYKLGFDREFFVGSVTDEQVRTYETTIAAQAAALDAIRPGTLAAQVHEAACEVYRSAGFDAGYRTGRGIGVSFLEAPELKEGDATRLAPGMTFAVDGGITVPNKFGTRVGDSIVVTETGYEVLTPYPNALKIL